MHDVFDLFVTSFEFFSVFNAFDNFWIVCNQQLAVPGSPHVQRLLAVGLFVVQFWFQGWNLVAGLVSCAWPGRR